MTPEEIRKFKREVAEPRIQQLLSTISIPEGFCCINNLEMSFWDGRSYGVSTEFIASGLQKRNGVITKYDFKDYDISCAEFVEAHKDCVFLSHSRLKIYDQLDNLTLVTDIGNLPCRCVEIFPELADCCGLKIQTSELEFLKMKELLVEQSKSDSLEEKVSLNDKIQSAASRTADSLNQQSAEHEQL